MNDMRGPLVSIILPAYNCGATIAAAVLGAVNQRYSNWEMVIVDDGSSEDFASEVEQFDDSRIHILRATENGGVAKALNMGLDHAKGRYIARMDADDYMEEWRLGEQLRFLMLEELEFCGTAAEKFGSETGLIRNAARGRDILDDFFAGNPFVHPTMMFDRERLGSQLRYDDTLRCEEDYELWARLATSTNCANFPEVTLRYRVREGGNANHLSKPRCNRLALQRFAERMGLGHVAPVATLSELQMSGFVDVDGYREMVGYAQAVEAHSWPKLGYLHSGLIETDGYEGFMRWLDGHQFRNFAITADEEAVFCDA